MNRRLRCRVVAALVAVTTIAGCGWGGDTENGASDAGASNTFSYALMEDPGNLHPFLTTANAAREVTTFLYDNLVYFDPETGEPKPWLAESWKESPTSVTYTLREGITCHDGTELTAETVANNFNWITDPDNDSAINGVLVPSDASATFNKKARTVTIDVENPSSFLLTQTGSLEIMCQAALDDPESAAAESVGTGLYEIADVVSGDEYVLERRDEYDWGPEGGNTSETASAPDTVSIQIVKNVSTAANLLLSGELNAATITGPDEERVAEETEAGRRVPMIIGQFYFSELDGKPTSDIRVRRAILQALDFKALTDIITGGKGYRAERLAMMDPNPCEYDATKGMLPEQDVDAAKSLLDDAGWTAGSDGVRTRDGERLELNLLFDISDEKSATMELVQQQLAEVGIEVSLDSGDTPYKLAQLYEKQNIGSYDIADAAINAWLPSIMTPWNSGPLPPGGRNSGGLDNREYERLIAKANSLAGAKSCDTWMHAEQALYEAADTIPYAARDTVTYLSGAELALPNTISGPSVRLTD